MSGRLRQLEMRSIERSAPFSLHLELTYRCNARCGHCLQDRGMAKAELDLPEWKKVLEEGRRLGILFAAISGGEALLSPHFFPVAEHTKKLGYALRIYSNGLLLDRTTVRKLAALKPFSVEVSIFSLDPERHDAAMGVPGSLRRALRGLLLLRRLGVHTSVKCPLLAGTATDHERVRALADRLGSSVVFDPSIFTAMDGRSGPTRCRGDDHALENFFAATEPLNDGKRPHAKPPGSPTCGMARSFVVVGPDGEVRPCVAMDLSAGNVKDAPLDRIFQDSSLMKTLRSRTQDRLRTCGDCERSGYCGRCSALALLEDGDLDGPSTRACHIAELREQAWHIPAPPAVYTPPPGAKRALRVL